SARIAARRERDSAAVSGRAPVAAARAASTSAGPACATIAGGLPSQGKRTRAAEMPGAGAPAASRGNGAATAAAEVVLSDIAANLRPCSASAGRAGSLQPEPDLQRHLVVRDLAVDDVAADVGDLEPVEVPKGGVGAADGVLDGVLEAARRRARELGDLVDLVTHGAYRTGAHGAGQRRQKAAASGAISVALPAVTCRTSPAVSGRIRAA